MKRILITLLLIVVVALALTLLMSLFAVGLVWLANLMHVSRPLGIDTQTSQNYDAVSGSGPMFIAALGFSGAFITILRHVNCHAPGCPRMGRYPTEGGEFKLCHIHHPEHDGERPTLADIHRKHFERKEDRLAS